MGYKQKSGPLQRAGYDKDATSPFRQDQDTSSGDILPSYVTTTYNANASGSGGGSSSKKLSTSNLSDYQSTLINLPDGVKATKKQTAAANAKVAELKALDKANAAANAASNSNSSQSRSESTSTSTTTLGDQTLNQIKKSGNIQVQNRTNKISATREAARNQAAIDSSKVANNFINKQSVSKQDNPRLIAVAQRHGNLAARKSLLKSGAYDGRAVRNMVKLGENYLGTE